MPHVAQIKSHIRIWRLVLSVCLFSDALTFPIALRGIVWPVLKKMCLCLEDAEQWGLTATGTSTGGTEGGRSHASSIAPSMSFPSSRMTAAQKAERYVHDGKLPANPASCDT